MKTRVVGLKELSREIDELRKKLGLSAGEFADLAAGTVRNAVVRNTQPFGLGKKAREKGLGAIRKDLLRAFRLAKRGSGRKSAIASVAEAKRWHQSRRNERGRVSRGEKRLILPEVFRAYLGELGKRVGLAKGSVLGGDDSRLRSGKGRGAPAWVKRWKGAGDSGRKRSFGGAEWTFRAEVEHIAAASVLGERGIKRAMRASDRNLKRILESRLKRLLKEAERKANR